MMPAERPRNRIHAWAIQRPAVWWGLTGLVLVGLHIFIAIISPEFTYGRDALKKPILQFVFLEVIACTVFLVVAGGIHRTKAGGGLLAWIIVVGTGIRVCMMCSTPILEDDYYRYLWDGSVFAHGMNPYSHSPLQITEDYGDATAVHPTLDQLASESGVVVHRVNHPDLRTIYPLTAQAAFALAHWIHPWSLGAWRLVLLLFDATVIALLAIILRSLRLPQTFLAVYLWNPLLVKEIFNSGHMDLIVLPFVLGAVLLAINRKYLTGAGTLAVATATKLWPIALLPLVLRPLLSSPKRIVSGLLIFFTISLVFFLPVYFSGLDSDSGFVAYGKRWEMNDALFMLPLWAFQSFSKIINGDPAWAKMAARLFVSLVLVAWIAWVSRNEPVDATELSEKCLLIVAAVFLLSPTQFPWYYVWLIPFLAIRPRFSLLLLTALLPLYYLRFYFLARDAVGIFDYGIVWVEYMPVWVLLIREWYLDRAGTPKVTEAVI